MATRDDDALLGAHPAEADATAAPRRSDAHDPGSPARYPCTCVVPRMRRPRQALLLPLLFACCMAVGLRAQDMPGEVLAEQKISATQGGLAGVLDAGDLFGWSSAGLGDLDGDGVPDLAVGAPGDEAGAVWILFLQPDGSVKAHTKISETSGGFGGALEWADDFGSALAALGDLDGDGVGDLAVGASGDGDGPAGWSPGRGAVWILFLDVDGTVKSETKISSTAGGFVGPLADVDRFGTALAAPGDLEGDGIVELVVGAPGDDDGGQDRGALWILSLDSDGTLLAERRISDSAGGLGGVLEDRDGLGRVLTAPGDLDGDGVPELVAGLPWSADATDPGSLLVLFLGAGGEVVSHQAIGPGQGDFHGFLRQYDQFGQSVAGIGDLDHDGVSDLVVGAARDDGGAAFPHTDTGAAYVLLLRADGTCRAHWKISAAQGGLVGPLPSPSLLGMSVADLGDLDGDGAEDVAVGAIFDPDGGFHTGACWVLRLGDDGPSLPWAGLTGGLAGAYGTPLLSGVGSLAGGSVVSLQLSGALELAPAWLLGGTAALEAPFKGGIVWPDIGAVALLLPFTTDVAGSLVVSSVWPSGLPAGVTSIWQAWVDDPAALHAWAASNGVLATTP